MPVSRNGFVLTGQTTKMGKKEVTLYPDGKHLVVVDFDVKRDRHLTLEEVDAVFPQTYSVRTGSGGLHLYYWIRYKGEIRSEKGLSGAKVGIKAIDTRAHHGIIYPPGCTFKDHGFTPYTEERQIPIAEITYAEYVGLVGPLPVDDDMKVVEECLAGLEDVPEPSLSMHDIWVRFLESPFQEIFSGQLQFGENAFNFEGKNYPYKNEEFNYWKCAILHSRSLGIPDALAFASLDRNQGRFDPDLMDNDLQGVGPETKPFKKITLEKMFPFLRDQNARLSIWYQDFVEWLLAKYEAIYWLTDMDQWVIIKWITIEEETYPLTYVRLDPDYAFIFKEINLWLRELHQTNQDLPLKAAHHTHVGLVSAELRGNPARLKTVNDFQSKGVLIFEDGYFRDGKFTPFQELDPEDYVLNFFHLPYKYQTLHEGATPMWDGLRTTYPTQLFWVEQFFLRILFNHNEDEYMMFMVGPAGSSKGTIESFFRTVFAEWGASLSLNTIGSQFGMNSLIGKRFCCDSDMSLLPLKPDTLSYIKKITGRDTTQFTIDIKHLNQAAFDFEIFFYGVANLLPRLYNVDLGGWFRRVQVLEFTEMVPRRDPQFKIKLRNEFPYVLWELLQMGVKPLPEEFYKSARESTWAADQESIWRKWSDPVAVACGNLFIASIESSVPYEMAFDKVCSEIRKIGFSVPKNETQLKKQITENLKSMFNVEVDSSGEKSYDGIAFQSEEVETRRPSRPPSHADLLNTLGDGMHRDDLIAAFPNFQEEAAEGIQALIIQNKIYEIDGELINMQI